MMKKHKGLIIGILIGASLMFSVQSFAEDGLTAISALLRTGLNITLDGQKVTLDNPSINYDGSTYLKLRDISKITGVGVAWNDSTQTVEITSATDSVYGTVTGSVYSTPTPEPTPHVSPIPSESVVTPPPSSDTIGVNTSDGGTTMSEGSAVFYTYTNIFTDIDKSDYPLMSPKNGTYVMNLTNENKDIPLIENKDYFHDTNTNIMYLSRELLLKYFSSDLLNKYVEYSINVTAKSVVRIN